MNPEDFKQYIKDTRDCDTALLDEAIDRGIMRAKNEKLDFKKLVNFAVMCAATAAFCIAINSVQAKELLPNNSLLTQSGTEAFVGYLNNIKDVLIIYLGGCQV